MRHDGGNLMRTLTTTLLAASISIVAPGLFAKPSSPFSESFKASIDNAMSKSNGQERADSITGALNGGTNKEVFFVFPLLFPSNIINAAEKAGVCKEELDASIENLEAYQSSSDPGSFPDSQSKKIRSDTTHLIQCLMPYYSHGQLAFPTAPATQ